MYCYSKPHNSYCMQKKIYLCSQFTNLTFHKKMMRTAFKINLLILSLFVLHTVDAQKIAIEGGYSNLVRHGADISNTYLNGNQLGLTVKVDLKKNFSLLSGVLYTVAYGEKKQVFPGSTSTNNFLFGLFADVPLQVQYSLPASKTFKFFAYAGPILNVGLYQKSVVNSTYTDVSSGANNLYTEKTLNRFNLQLGGGAGMQFKNFILKGGYDFGVLDLNKATKVNIYQDAWRVSFAYEW